MIGGRRAPHEDAAEIGVLVSALTDVGTQRRHNEDSLLVADLDVDAWTGATPLPLRAFADGEDLHLPVGQRGLLFLVADGMGGARAGDVASNLAAGGLHTRLSRTWTPSPHPNDVGLARALTDAVTWVNSDIHTRATQEPTYEGMGSTLTAAVLLGARLFLAQVGDSRAYLIRNGNAARLTRDQSVVEHLIRSGRMTEEQAITSRVRNVLMQALGTAPAVEVDLSSQSIRANDRVVLCSDGLTRAVPDGELAEIVSDAAAPWDTCRRLVDLANARGGVDNVTVLVAHATGAGLVPPGADEPAGYARYELSPTL